MSARSRAALFAAAVAALSQVAASATASQPAFDPKPYLRPQQLVDIGGRRLNLYCSGHGSPTVVLEAGGGDDMLDWRFVQPRLAMQTRVCSYDRAAFGFSDAGPLPRDASASVADLHALVEKAGVARPFVLVGYSTGENYARLYADRYLHDLAGLVLVEPAFEGEEEARADAAIPFLAQNAAQQAILDRACAAGAEPNGLRPKSETYVACAPQPDPAYPAALNSIIFQQYLRPKFWNAYISENDDSDRSATPVEVRKEQRAYGKLPLVLLTVKNELPDGALQPAQVRILGQILDRGRALITNYSSRSSHVTIAKCNHGNVTTLCANDVAAAIRAVAAKSTKPGV